MKWEIFVCRACQQRQASSICKFCIIHGTSLRECDFLKPVFYRKPHSCWVVFAKKFNGKCDANAKLPNAKYIPPARVGSCVGHYRLVLGIIRSLWGLRLVRKTFGIRFTKSIPTSLAIVVFKCRKRYNLMVEFLGTCQFYSLF